MLPSSVTIRLLSVMICLIGSRAAPTHHIQKRGLPRLGGVNLSGCDFDVTINGAVGRSMCPDTSQIKHFADRGANLFRLPFGWQYFVNYNLDYTTIDEAFFVKYDKLVQASLATGAYVMIDLHNYARWNGVIIGQATNGQVGPSNEQFATLWSNIAKRYKSQERVIFGIMNEPHDLDMIKWGVSVQGAVNAIRAAGATSQSIALPGTLFTHAEQWNKGANNPVVAVTDPAHPDKSKLIIDVHQYFDAREEGKSTECVKNGLDKARELADWLNLINRKALVSEVGGGNTPSCHTNFGQYLQFISTNDAYLGFAAWAGGSFDASYELSITPQNGEDNDLFKLAIQPYLPNRKSGTSETVNSPPTVNAPPVSSPGTTVPVPASVAPAPAPPAAADTASVPPGQSVPAAGTPPVASPPTLGGDLQRFAGVLGGTAPEVHAVGTEYKSGWKTFPVLLIAVQSSCYTQRDGCLGAAGKSGNIAPLTTDGCQQQTTECLNLASA